MIGQTILHYRITAKLGAGGMGTVYLALDTKLNRQVALKFLPDDLSRDEPARSRLLREARAASQLNHPNIMMVHSIEEANGLHFIVMEYVKGTSLADFIATGRHSHDEILDIAIQIVDGLDVAHHAGVVHRDLKPANVVIDDKGRVRILDFGLARLDDEGMFSETGSTLGTLAYCSPEQAQGIEADHRSDIFSFGAVLYEMLTLRRPFRGHHEAALIYSIVNETPEPLSQYRPDATENLQRIIAKCLAKRPEDRYGSAAVLAGDLRSAKRSVTSIPSLHQHAAQKQIPSIAVLPLANLSADRNQEYFCDGITEEIIHALTHVEGLRVVARTSVLVFRDKNEDIRTIGQKLNADVVLEGSVRTAGTRIRINVQLISVTDGYHIWGERYDREMSDVFAIQDEITLAIVDKLKVSLLSGEKAKLVKRHTGNLEAFHLYLEGRYFWNRRFEGGLQRGIECFQRAIAHDPEYATAYSGIADCYSVLGYFGALPPRDVYSKAKSAAAKALAIDEELAEAHTSMGWVKTYFDWDWAGGAAEYNRAQELNPQYATTHEWWALHLCITGRFDEAVAAARHALELDRLSLIINSVVGVVLYMARRYEEAIDQQKMVIGMDPNFALAYWFLAGNYLERQMWRDAISALEKQISLSGESPMALASLGMAHGRSGQTDKALELLTKLQESKRRRYVSPFHEALIHMGVGQLDDAFSDLDAAIEVRESLLVYLNVWPFLDTLRPDRRFSELLSRIGLPA